MNHQHRFLPATIYKNYEYCLDCGSYHSTAQVDPKVIYETKEYWGDGTGRSSLEEQMSNITCIDECGISKVDRIMQFVPDSTRNALEIGCAPGALMGKLVQKGIDTWGIEPSVKYIDFICRQAIGAKVLHGMFPKVTSQLSDKFFDCIIAMDVFEHIEDYNSFIQEIQRLLEKDGTAIIMSPIILNEDGFLRERDMQHPDEHCWIFTQKFLEPYLKEIFSEVKFGRWICGHEIIILKK